MCCRTMVPWPIKYALSAIGSSRQQTYLAVQVVNHVHFHRPSPASALFHPLNVHSHSQTQREGGLGSRMAFHRAGQGVSQGLCRRAVAETREAVVAARRVCVLMEAMRQWLRETRSLQLLPKHCVPRRRQRNAREATTPSPCSDPRLHHQGLCALQSRPRILWKSERVSARVQLAASAQGAQAASAQLRRGPLACKTLRRPATYICTIPGEQCSQSLVQPHTRSLIPLQNKPSLFASSRLHNTAPGALIQHHQTYRMRCLSLALLLTAASYASALEHGSVRDGHRALAERRVHQRRQDATPSTASSNGTSFGLL